MTKLKDTVDENAPRDAADWFARLRSDEATAQDWTAFEAWLGVDPSHESAFRAIEALWIDLESSGGEVSAGEVLPFRRPPKKGNPILDGEGERAAAVGRPSRLVWAGLAAGFAAVLFVVAGGPQFLAGDRIPSVLDVPLGQTRTLALQGGRATVEGGTRLELASTANGQRVRLQTGTARFSLKHDPARTLTVLAGGERITDIGTVFTTLVSADALLVSVSEGEVEVKPTTGPGQAVRVHAGQALVRHAGEASSGVLGADLIALRRPYQNMELSDVVADLNQFYSRPIRIDGTSVERLRFTGVLVLDSEEAVVRRLEAYWPVTARVSANAIVLAPR